jgi:hypothetical protein
MGRLLKLLAFTHDEGIAVRALGGGNILLEPSQHFALVFDWSSAMVYQAEVPMKVRKDDIAGAAKAVLASIGNTETGEYPYPLGDDKPYVDPLGVGESSEADPTSTREVLRAIEQLWA